MKWNFPFGRKRIPEMRESVTHYEKDRSGNHWYLTELNSACKGTLLKDYLKDKTSFDMTTVEDKARAIEVCTPFGTVINKIGNLFANGKYYVVDQDNNEEESEVFREIRSLLKKPNPIQTGRQFSKQIEMTLKVFGFCPIYMNRLSVEDIPRTMFIIPPLAFHLIPTGKLYDQIDKEGIIEEVYLDLGNGQVRYYKPEEYFIIYESEMNIPLDGYNDEITFQSATDCLSAPISNWVAAMAASNTLIASGGPKGIIYSNDKSEFGNGMITPKEKENLQHKFNHQYGLVDKEYSIYVSAANLGWIPLNYDSGQLKLHEEDDRCSEKIYNALGLNPNVFVSKSKYSNAEVGDETAYQNLIIPDAELIAESLTEAICPEGITIKLDYTHIDSLQKDKSATASTLNSASNALKGLLDAGLITVKEARKELSNYIDIDPDNKEYGDNRIEE